MQPRELRAIWERDVDRLVNACIPIDPSAWRTPSGSDPWVLLDVQEANRALSRGCPVHIAAGVLAARALARAYGRQPVREAILLAPMRYRPEPPRKRGPQPTGV